jgi:hypothetical protein
MEKKYTSHLCTFMGREANVKILLQYVERALALNAVDNYWMIDMTRCISDHEYIYSEQQRLNEKFPGRVHVYNREKRAEELKDPEAIKSGIGGWKTFYEFLNRFSDNDVIAKCDDDTLYFDVETLGAAFDFRWKKKQPYLMHANCINNGITAYHQHKKGIWQTNETDVYPSCGLTGPLFSFPEIACEHHKAFSKDLSQSHDNIKKYQLGKNILFQQRVSINFIFMLGSDRGSLSTIDLQDEYETSSKKPQIENRPNCIIGDFTAVHHTYGVQEPIMEELGTYEAYESLADDLAKKEDYQPKQINDYLSKFTTLSLGKGQFLAKYPASPKTKIIQHADSGMFLAIRGVKQEKVNFDKDRNKIPTGLFMLQNETYACEDVHKAALMEFDLNSPTTLKFTNSNKIIRTGGSRKELDEGYTPEKDFFPGHLIAEFFKGGYKTELVNFVKQPSGNYKIQSNTHKDFYLNFIINKNTGRVNTRYEKDCDCEFIIHEKSSMQDALVSIQANRCKDVLMNDSTSYDIIQTKDHIFKAREYYWMIDHYIWEIVDNGDNKIKFKLIADELEDLYLSAKEDGSLYLGKEDLWAIKDGLLVHEKTGKSIEVTKDKIFLSNNGTKFNLDL